jgi:hypothetical protein
MDHPPDTFKKTLAFDPVRKNPKPLNLEPMDAVQLFRVDTGEHASATNHSQLRRG